MPRVKRKCGNRDKRREAGKNQTCQEIYESVQHQVTVAAEKISKLRCKARELRNETTQLMDAVKAINKDNAVYVAAMEEQLVHRAENLVEARANFTEDTMMVEIEGKKIIHELEEQRRVVEINKQQLVDKSEQLKILLVDMEPMRQLEEQQKQEIEQLKARKVRISNEFEEDLNKRKATYHKERVELEEKFLKEISEVRGRAGMFAMGSGPPLNDRLDTLRASNTRLGAHLQLLIAMKKILNAKKDKLIAEKINLDKVYDRPTLVERLKQ